MATPLQQLGEHGQSVWLDFISRELVTTGQLERRIAEFKQTEACVVFQSGFAANAGTVSAILGPEDHIVSDALNHASIIDGCRLSRAKIHVFPHKDTAAAEKLLQDLAGECHPIVVHEPEQEVTAGIRREPFVRGAR